MTDMLASSSHHRSSERWQEADTIWERTQEKALKAYRAGDMGAASGFWVKALKIAKRHFKRGDPRLATSFTNQAYDLMRKQQTHEALRHFEEAIQCWQDSWRWVPLMTPPADEGLAYDASLQQEFHDFLKQGQTMTEMLERERALPCGGLEDWAEYRPASLCDLRKLISAVFLIVSDRPDH